MCSAVKISGGKILANVDNHHERLLAARTKHMKASMLRELLKVTMQPGMISLAGGLPASESFPLEIMDELASLVLKKYSSTALQYGPTEGFSPLREVLAEMLVKRGIQCTGDEVIITSGSQGLLDSIAKILVSKGEKVAIEAPTYLGALSAFNPYEPHYIGLKTDGDGLIPESLEEVLSEHDIKFVYLVPTFQNPTGRTIPLGRRKQIAEIIVRHDALLVEDDPYSALRYSGEDLPTIKMFAPENVVYTSTMSKILAPGLRCGFCVAPKLIRKWLVLAKQGVDLHTSSFDQALATEYLAGGYLVRQLPKIIQAYKPRLDAMLKALEKYFPGDFQWSKPEGGMFVWAEGPEGLDTDELYPKAVERKVVYVPGKYFYTTDGQGLGTMRLNFSNGDEASIDKGIKIISEVMSQHL